MNQAIIKSLALLEQIAKTYAGKMENVRVSTGTGTETKGTLNVNSLKKSIAEIITKKVEFHSLLNKR